jgi:hypothetical protein
MANTIDNAEIELECENCGGKTKKSAEWIKQHDQFTCELWDLDIRRPEQVSQRTVEDRIRA